MKMTYLPLILLLALAACQKKDSDKIAEAQACLDELSNSNEALACMEKIEGVDSPAASLIRCSAHMIYQEFTNPQRLIQISEQLSDSGGANSTNIALGLLAFTKPSGAGNENARAALAEEAFGHCEKSGSKGMTLLAAASRIGSEIATIAPTILDDCDPASPGYSANNCAATVQTASCTASPTVLGQTALAAYQQSCLGSSQENSSVCADFAAATSGTSDPAVIGANLQTELGCPP